MRQQRTDLKEEMFKLRITKEERDALKEYSDTAMRSQSDIVRTAVKEYIKNRKGRG